MFARIKKSGQYQYLQIIQNHKEKGKVRQQVMAVMFTHATSMHEGCDFKTAKEVINFALNMNRALRLGDHADMVHLSPFSLYLL